MEEKETRVSPEDVQQDVPPAEETKADEALSDALSKALEAEAAAEARAKELEDKAAGLEKKLALAVRQYGRLQGDFDNFRRRTRNEQAEAKDKMTADVVKEFLPVLDNFDLALAHMARDEAGAAYVKGFAMLQKQMEKVLTNLGVAEIAAEGAPFDPHFHEAVMQVPAPDKEDDTVAAVFQKGYAMKDRVIRPAKVQVVHNG